MTAISYRFQECELTGEQVSGAAMICACGNGWRVITISVDNVIIVSGGMRNQVVSWLHGHREEQISHALKIAARPS